MATLRLFAVPLCVGAQCIEPRISTISSRNLDVASAQFRLSRSAPIQPLRLHVNLTSPIFDIFRTAHLREPKSFIRRTHTLSRQLSHRPKRKAALRSTPSLKLFLPSAHGLHGVARISPSAHLRDNLLALVSKFAITAKCVFQRPRLTG